MHLSLALYHLYTQLTDSLDIVIKLVPRLSSFLITFTQTECNTTYSALLYHPHCAFASILKPSGYYTTVQCPCSAAYISTVLLDPSLVLLLWSLARAVYYTLALLRSNGLG